MSTIAALAFGDLAGFVDESSKDGRCERRMEVRRWSDIFDGN